MTRIARALASRRQSNSSAAPEWDDAFGELWASYVEDFRIDLPLHRAVLTVSLIEGDVTSFYEIQFEGISRLVFADDRRVVWGAAWIEDAGQRAVGNQILFSLGLAGVDDSLEVTCAGANVVRIGTASGPTRERP